MTKDVQSIYTRVLNDIVFLRLTPGSRVREVDMSARYGVSRTPIRDVFKKLEDDQLLIVYSQSGSYVSKIDLSGTQDIMYLRYVTECAVMEDLMETITPEDIADLRTLVKSQRELLAKGDADKNAQSASSFFELDNAFHRAVYQKGGKESILDLLNASYPSFSRYRFLTFLRDDVEIINLFDIHNELIDCLEKKDHKLLKEVSLRHNYSGLNGIDKVKERHPEYFINL